MHHPFGSLARSIVLVLLIFGSLNAEPMSRITGEHFDVFTTGSPDDAREALAALEQARVYFVSARLIQPQGERPVRVVAFHSEEEYAAFRLHRNAFAHFFKGTTCSFIVLTDLLPEHREALLHEYTHAVIRQAGLSLPQWLNEGIADLYSSLSVADGHAVIGLPLEGRIRTIKAEGLMPLSNLFSSGTLAGNGSNAPLLYAQSWALTHMLCFAPEYAGNFGRLLAAANKTMDSESALQRIFGKNLAQLQDDLARYLTGLSYATGAVNIETRIPLRAGTVQLLSGGEREAVLTRLLEEQPWTRSVRQTD